MSRRSDELGFQLDALQFDDIILPPSNLEKCHPVALSSSTIMSNNDNRAPRRNISQQSTGSQSRNVGGRMEFSSALNPVSRTSSIRSRLGPQHSADIAKEYSIYDPQLRILTEARNPFRDVSRMAAQARQYSANTEQAKQTTEEGSTPAIQPRNSLLPSTFYLPFYLPGWPSVNTFPSTFPSTFLSGHP